LVCPLQEKVYFNLDSRERHL